MPIIYILFYTFSDDLSKWLIDRMNVRYYHLLKYVLGEKIDRGEIPGNLLEAKISMGRYSGMMRPSLSSLVQALDLPLNVPYLTSLRKPHDFFFGDVFTSLPFIFWLRYSLTACKLCSTTSIGGDTIGLPSALSFLSRLMQPMDSGKTVILL